MRIKPWPIIILALFNFLCPIGNIILSAHLEKITVLMYLKDFFHDKTYWDLLPLVIAPWVSAYAVFAVKEWSFFVFMSVVAFQTGNVLYQWHLYPQMLSLPTALSISALNAAFGYYFLLPEVRTVYRNKALRWWEQAPRYEVNMKCRVQTSKKSKLKAAIIDLSEGGVLLKLKPKERLHREDEIELRFSHNDNLTFIHGRIVYSRGDGHYGVQFMHNNATMKFMQTLVAELKKSGNLARGRVSLSDDFNRWAKELVSKGEGWRPAIPDAYKPVVSTQEEAAQETVTETAPATTTESNVVSLKNAAAARSQDESQDESSDGKNAA